VPECTTSTGVGGATGGIADVLLRRSTAKCQSGPFENERAAPAKCQCVRGAKRLAERLTGRSRLAAASIPVSHLSKNQTHRALGSFRCRDHRVKWVPARRATGRPANPNSLSSSFRTQIYHISNRCVQRPQGPVNRGFCFSRRPVSMPVPGGRPPVRSAFAAGKSLKRRDFILPEDPLLAYDDLLGRRGSPRDTPLTILESSLP
jgi:hypothetical protein